MKPSSQPLTSLILKRTPYGEADLIVTFFSRERGKLSGMARHAKKSMKRFGNVLSSLAVVRLEVTESPGRELVRLERGEPVAVFERAAGDPLCLGLAGYALELVDGLQAPLDPAPELFDLLVWLLGRLDRGERVEEAAFIFGLRLLNLTGYGPNLTVCPHCGRPATDFSPAALDPGQGGLVCLEAGPQAQAVSTGALKIMDRALALGLDKIDRLRVTPRVLDEAEPFLRRYAAHILGREPRSARYLDQIRKGRPAG